MKYAAYNHNGTVLGVFDTPGEAAKEAEDYTHVTGNASYTDEIEGIEDECSSCDGTGMDLNCHNSVAPKDVGFCKACKGKG